MTRSNVTVPESELRPAGRLSGLSPYEPPKQSPFVDLCLDANEGASPGESVASVLPNISLEDLRKYPSSSELERQIADTLGIKPERVIVTNGADDAIDRVCRSVLEPGREAVLHRPTFEMIERGARLAGADVRSFDWFDRAFPLAACDDSITERTSLVALVSPNNPTGGVISTDDMRKVARAASRVGALAMIDLAYVEFADEDPTRALLDEPNVVVLRTFSKAMGLAGARAGYAIASPEVARWLRTVGGPYPVSSVSAALAGAALRSADEREAYIDAVRSERKELASLLQKLGCEVFETQANFVTARFRDAAFVREALASLGIAVRAFPSRPELQNHLRISLPGEIHSFERLLAALRTVLEPEAILFDLDGVLADVSGSYRGAIIETARSFGVAISQEDVTAAKRAGNANNDWELTKRLIESRGVQCELNEIINRFQSIYEGTGNEAGLRETERLIPAAEVLQSLAERCTLAIVTGRPRAEAEWFLERAGVRGLFKSLVCMEDAPAKPSPEPIERAMNELGIVSAWMIGDTPDDMVSARSASVLPIGFPAPGEDYQQASEVLRDAGAGAVISQLEQIGALIHE